MPVGGKDFMWYPGRFLVFVVTKEVVCVVVVVLESLCVCRVKRGSVRE